MGAKLKFGVTLRDPLPRLRGRDGEGQAHKLRTRGRPPSLALPHKRGRGQACASGVAES